MKTEIIITIEGNKLYIREASCLPEEYTISEDSPIDDICENLHDYLEGFDAMS